MAVALLSVAETFGSAAADEVRYQVPESPVRSVMVGAEAIWVEDDGDDVLKHRNRGPGRPIPELALTEPAVEPVEAPLDVEPEWPDVLWSVRHQGASQPGQPLSYTTLGAFVPRTVPDGMWFTETRFHLDNGGHPGGSAGLGRRWYDRDANQIIGMGIWYDARETAFDHWFHQAGISVEWLGDRWDMRANYYAPLGDPVVAGGPTTYGPPAFDGYSLVRTVMSSNQAALQGGDVELARRIGMNNVWAYAGSYHYQRDAVQLYGASGGVRGFVTRDIAADVAATHDREFDTNVVFAVTWFFPGGTSRGAMPRDVEERIWQPMERSDAVAVARVAGATTTETLHAPGGGSLRFVHIDAAAPPGSGTHAAPFATLAAAQAGSVPGDILFVHSGGTFTGESIQLQDGQSLLGEGIDHQVDTLEAGEVALPAGNGGFVSPVIANAPGDAIRMAANTAVSGLDVQTPIGRGIVAQNITGDARIDRMRVVNSGMQGILVDNVDGRVLVRDTWIHGSSNEGLAILISNPLVTNATIDGLVMAGGPPPGFLAVNAGPAGASLRLNLFDSDSDSGFQLISNPAGLFELGGGLGTGSPFVNSDNGNIANNGNRSGGAPPTVSVNGTLWIVDPLTIPAP